MVLVAHMADVHLGYRQYNLVEREEDVYEAFDESVESIIKEHVDVLLIAGDLFDSVRPPIRALKKAKDAFRRLSDRGVRTLYVLGDHDMPKRRDELAPARLFDGLEHVGFRNVGITLGSQKLVVTGLDRFPASLAKEAIEEASNLASEASNLSKLRVMVAHVSLGDVERLPDGYSYYALGHEHKRMVFKKGGSLAAYPDAIEILSRSEVEGWEKEGKGFYIVDMSGDEPLIHKVNVKSTRPQKIAEVRVEELKEKVNELLEWASKIGRKPVVHVTVTGKRVDSGRVAELLQGLKEVTLYYRYEVKEELSGEALVDVGSLDVSRLLVDYMKKKGFGDEDSRFAAELYEAFRTGGYGALEDVVKRRLRKVLGDEG